MFPILQIGPLAIQTYPLILLLALWAALAVSARAARWSGMDGDHIYNMGLYALVAGLIAARLGHVVAFWPAYRTQPLEIIGLNTRAFILWPGIVIAVMTATWYIYRHRLPWGNVLDASAPGMLVGAALASLAALLSGQAAAAPAPEGLPWAVNLWGVRRHPSPVYEMLAWLFVMGIVLSVLARGGRRGTAAWIALLGYGLGRWLLAPFRAVEGTATILGGLRVPQLLGLAVALVALWRLRPLAPGLAHQAAGEAADS